jgi:hypothetical protein
MSTRWWRPVFAVAPVATAVQQLLPIPVAWEAIPTQSIVLFESLVAVEESTSSSRLRSFDANVVRILVVSMRGAGVVQLTMMLQFYHKVHVADHPKTPTSLRN